MMSRYSDFSYFMEMDASEGAGLAEAAVEQDGKEKLYQMYVNLVPVMDKDSYISFEDYYLKSKGKSKVAVEKVNKEDVMEKVKNILSNYSV